jgi:hypothetical protein
MFLWWFILRKPWKFGRSAAKFEKPKTYYIILQADQCQKFMAPNGKIGTPLNTSEIEDCKCPYRRNPLEIKPGWKIPAAR